MITSEFTTPVSTVRIHDDYLDSGITNRMDRVSHIVSESYRRRLQMGREDQALKSEALPMTGKG